jgi:FkbM family methyltransferase
MKLLPCLSLDRMSLNYIMQMKRVRSSVIYLRLHKSTGVFNLLIMKLIRAFVMYLAKTGYLKLPLTSLARDYMHRVRGFSYEFSENGELEIIAKVSERFSDLVFFDVGANVGDFTAQLLLQSKGEITGHLFDLDQNLATKLEQRFIDSKVRVNNFGLSNRYEKIAYSRFPDFPAANSLLDVEFSHLRKETHQALVRTGDEYCDELSIPRINFVKIDVEGWERYVLEGFSQMLLKHRIDAISWEYGYTTAETHWTTKDFFTFFETKGYVCGVIRKSGIEFSPWSYDMNDYTSGPNYFACLPLHKEFFSAR